MSEYNYVVTSPFDISNFSNNIMSSSIVTALQSVTINNTNLVVTFVSDLFPSEEIQLQYLIDNNDILIKQQNIKKEIIIVSVATTTNGNLSTDFEAGDVIDGVTLERNSLILIKDQTNAIENGVYSIRLAGPPERDILLNDTNAGGSVIMTNRGENNANKMWLCTSEIGSDIVGRDQLIFDYYNPITTTQVHIPFSDGSTNNVFYQSPLPNVYTSIKTFLYSRREDNLVKFTLVYAISSIVASFDFRIQDVTHSKTIANITGLTNTNGIMTTVQTTVFTNVPTEDSVFEIQYRETTGNGDVIALYSAYFEYS